MKGQSQPRGTPQVRSWPDKFTGLTLPPPSGLQPRLLIGHTEAGSQKTGKATTGRSGPPAQPLGKRAGWRWLDRHGGTKKMPHMVVSPEHIGKALEDLETGGRWVSMRHMPGMPAHIPSTPFLWVENFSPCEPLFQEGDAPLPAALITAAQPHDLGSTNQARPWDARCGRKPVREQAFWLGWQGCVHFGVSRSRLSWCPEPMVSGASHNSGLSSQG